MSTGTSSSHLTVATKVSSREPMVPAEVDLRGLEYMPLLGAKLFASDFHLEASDAEFRRALVLWWAAWNQQPAASLPNSDRAQAKLAGFEDEKSPTWRKVRGRVLHGFELCSDGRLYHPILAEQALIAWEKRAEDRAMRDNEADRKRRERALRSEMFAQLRAVGFTPAWNIKMIDLRDLVTQHVTRTGSETVTPNVTPPVTRTHARTDTRIDTAKTGRDGTGQEERESHTRTATPSAVAREPEPDQLPTRAGTVCRAMKRAGVADPNPGHPDLLALIAAGATEPEFLGAAQMAVDRGKGFAYAIGALKRQRTDAAKTAETLHTGAMPQPPPRQSAADRRAATVEAFTGPKEPHERPDQSDIIDIESRAVG